MSNVDHPAHYGGADNPYEAIKIIEALGLNFNLGNAMKYLVRAGRKHGAFYEDVAKARWYVSRELVHGRVLVAVERPQRRHATCCSNPPSSDYYAPTHGQLAARGRVVR